MPVNETRWPERDDFLGLLPSSAEAMENAAQLRP